MVQVDVDPDFLDYMQREYKKKKELAAVITEMNQLMQDHSNNIPNFIEKHPKPSREFALLKYKRYCIERGLPYNETGSK